MKNLILFLLVVSFFGCAFVEYKGSEKKMHTYFISEEEISDTLDKVEQKYPEETKEYILLEDK